MDEEVEDRELTEAYARLGTALLPPPDVAARVERQVGTRRRRRRTAVAGAAALVVAAGAAGAVVATTGDDGKGVVATDHSDEGRGSFTLTRADGSTATFDDLTVSCDKGPTGEPVEPGRIWLYSPFHLDASGDALTEPYISFSAVVDRADGKSYTLPVDNTVADSGYPVVLLYAAEADPGTKQRANEVSSAEAGATGTVHVVHASCDPVAELELEVDATLGSEVEQGTEQLSGSYR
jgi:hypothetical protein